jgi:hypothetical protein
MRGRQRTYIPHRSSAHGLAGVRSSAHGRTALLLRRLGFPHGASSSASWLSSHTRRLSLTVLLPLHTAFKLSSRSTVASRTVILHVEPRLCPTVNRTGWRSSLTMQISACSSREQAPSEFVAGIPRNLTRTQLSAASSFHHRASRSSRCWRAHGSRWHLAHCRACSSPSAVMLRRADSPLNAATNSSIRRSRLLW